MPNVSAVPGPAAIVRYIIREYSNAWLYRRRVNLQQIRYLCAVVDHGLNVSVAADALFTSQPGISKQIRQLEEELGVPIFIRQGKRLTALTEGGEVIVATARRALQELNNLKRVGAEYPLPRVSEGRRRLWLRDDLDAAILPPEQASAARIPGPPAFPTIATRRPGGSGWLARTCATSSNCSSVSTRITPACRKSASTATSGDANAAVCDDAARRPADVRPLLTARIGLCRPMRRVSRANFAGLPNDSR